ncbi:hypothetical protein Vretimale_16013 [Volvox reticuliferus]|uniref:Uncharacterized protein n=1 Tax=Volvox reticuliferus TaxID=1737510 RepID=A0A8J4LWB7_9CHLO|nr:hypothetical protein Vretifemale_9753 [Volvox reticuliferus]GIM12769.1 hypothetical protein Vretimale_16013 [Volvox reticuliferus]
MCAVQDAVTQSDCVSLEQSEMAVSVIAVCRHSDKLLRANEQLSIMVTTGTFTQPQAEEVDVAFTTVSEAQQQLRQGHAENAGRQGPVERAGGETSGQACGPTSTAGEVSQLPVDAGTIVACNTDVAVCGAIALTKTGTVLRGTSTNCELRTRSAAGVLQPETGTGHESNAKQAPEHDIPLDRASPGLPVSSNSTIATATKPDISTLASAVAASKLGLVDQLSQALATCAAVAFAKDTEDRTCLHYAAGYGHEECVSLLLEHHSDTRVRDANGDVPLHFAAIHGHPMCAYNITKAGPSTCLTRNFRGQTPVEVAVACERGEVLNAMLLACAGDGSGGVTVQAMRKLLASGAVPDTWAPNGSSALMLAAAANGTEALAVLLEAGATLELQDALGRSALMFAAGNCAKNTLVALLDAGACISQRDRRGRNVLDYAPAGSEVRRLLQARLDELEAVANKLQADLLASLGSLDVVAGPSGSSNSEAKTASGSGRKKKQQSAGKKGSTATLSLASKANPNVSSGSGPSGPTGAAASRTGVAAKTKSMQPATDGSPTAAGVSPSLQAPMAAANDVVVEEPIRSYVASDVQQDNGSCDNDASEWQTVSSYKCAAKTRQQQQQQSEHDTQRLASNGGTSAVAACGLSTTAASAGGCARHGRGALASSVGAAAIAAATATSGRSGSTCGRSTSSQSGARGKPMQPSGVATAPASTTMAASPHPKGMPGSGKGSGGSSIGVGHGTSDRKSPEAGTAVALASNAPLSAETLAPSVPAAAPPVSGFKAALLGLDAQASNSAAASTCAAVHLDLPPITVVMAGTTARPPVLPQRPAIALTPATAYPALSVAGERKPAWGGAKLGVQPVPSPATSVAGCSPRSYPPLVASAVNGIGSSSQVGPPQLVNAKSVPPTAPAAAPGTRQPHVQSRISAVPLSPAAPPSTPAAAAAASNFLAPPSCAETCSAAAVSMPPSITSLAESEASSSTGTCSSQHTGAGASSPRSFGHDWTRPSPVDVLLQAAIAAAVGDVGGSDQQSSDGKLPGHSKSISAASSSSCLSFDVGTGLTPLDAVMPQILPPPSQQQQTTGLPCLGVSHLGGTEVPPPVRRSREGTALLQMKVILKDRIPTATTAAAAVEPRPLTEVSQCSTSCVTAAAAGAGGRPGGRPSGGGATGAFPNGGGRSGGKAATNAGGGSSTVLDVAGLKAENEGLQRRLRQVEQRHSQELAAVIFDAEEHEAAVVERAIARERLRITANLLAIGLCPEAILAVITPPGHGLDLQHLLATELTGAGGLAAPPQPAQQAPDPTVPQVAAPITLPVSLDETAPTPSLAPPAPAASSSNAKPMAPVSAQPGIASAAPGNASGGLPPMRDFSPSGSFTTAASGGSAATAAAGARRSGSSTAICGGSSGHLRPHHSSCDSAPCAMSRCSSRCWTDGCCAGHSGCSAASPNGLDGGGTVANGCGGGNGGPTVASLPLVPSAAIAIPCSGDNANLSFHSTASTAAHSHSYRSSRMHGFGSPGGVGSGFGGRGSFGSGCGVVGSLCGGLGLGILSSVAMGDAGGCGLAEAAPEGAREEEEGEMDLPACGDISALLAMSDDDGM